MATCSAYGHPPHHLFGFAGLRARFEKLQSVYSVPLGRIVVSSRERPYEPDGRKHERPFCPEGALLVKPNPATGQSLTPLPARGGAAGRNAKTVTTLAMYVLEFPEGNGPLNFLSITC